MIIIILRGNVTKKNNNYFYHVHRINFSTSL